MNRLSFTRPLKSVLPVRPALALGLVLAALSLPAIAQAPPPMDELLVSGSECTRGGQCQSEHCWKGVGEEWKTCQDTEIALSAIVAMGCPGSAEVMGSWDRWPDGRFDPEPREWPMTVKRWAGPGAVPTQTEGTAHSRGEMGGRALTERWAGGLEGVTVTGYDDESDAYSSVVMSAVSGCVVLSGVEDDDGVTFSGDKVSRSLGYEGQRIEVSGLGGSGSERIEIVYPLELDKILEGPQEAPPPVAPKKINGSECTRSGQCQSEHCWKEASEEKKTCKAEAKPAAG